MCEKKKYLAQEDIFFIWGSSAFSFIDDCLNLHQMATVAGNYEQFTYMALCKELHKEDQVGLIEVLKSCKQLKHLIWRGQQISSFLEGTLKAFELSDHIISLNLGTNTIGDSGTKQLCQSMSLSKTLKTINLSSNNIGLEGAKYLGEFLEKTKSLKRLMLSKNKIRDEGCQYLRSGLEKASIVLLDLGKAYEKASRMQ